MVKHITMEALQEVYLELAPKSLGIADLGCSSGSNSLSIIKDIVEAVEAASCKIMIPAPEFRVYLNDLPTNDFNSIFKSLPDFYRDLNKERSDGPPLLFIAGYPGSFYGRLFPNDCLHFVHSSYSLHWLSKVRFFPFFSPFLSCLEHFLRAGLSSWVNIIWWPFSSSFDYAYQSNMSCRFLHHFMISKANRLTRAAFTFLNQALHLYPKHTTRSSKRTSRCSFARGLKNLLMEGVWC